MSSLSKREQEQVSGNLCNKSGSPAPQHDTPFEGSRLIDYDPSDALPESQHLEKTVEDLIELLDTSYLDLNPSYQREVVWSKARMSSLIKSIMDNYYVPPLVFHLEPLFFNHGQGPLYHRTCLDGKQRLSSLKAFINGEISVSDAQGIQWYFKDNRDSNQKHMKQRNFLSAEAKAKFTEKIIYITEYQNLDLSQQERLFASVQTGVVLTKAECINATRGGWQTLAREFKGEFEKVMSLITDKRQSAFINILACFSQMLETKSPTSATGRPSSRVDAANIQKMLNKSTLLTEQLRSDYRRVFTTFAELQRHHGHIFENKGLRGSKTFSPIEMVTVTVLIFCLPRNTLDELAGAIIGLREELRRVNTDLRSNSKVWGDAWAYIETLLPAAGRDSPAVPSQPHPTTDPAASLVSELDPNDPLAAIIAYNRAHDTATNAPGPPAPSTTADPTAATTAATPTSVSETQASPHQPITNPHDYSLYNEDYRPPSLSPSLTHIPSPIDDDVQMTSAAPDNAADVPVRLGLDGDVEMTSSFYNAAAAAADEMVQDEEDDEVKIDRLLRSTWDE